MRAFPPGSRHDYPALRRLIPIVISVAFTLPAKPAAQAGYTLVPLPAPASDVSDSGTVVGQWAGAGGSRAYAWTQATGAQPMISDAAIINRFPCTPPKINANGVVVGQASPTSCGQAPFRAARYSSTFGLEMASTAEGDNGQQATAVNASGAAAGNYRGNGVIPFMWPFGGSLFPLPAFTFFESGTANGINDANVIVGRCSGDSFSTWCSGGSFSAYWWASNQRNLLPKVAGRSGANHEAFAINNNGQIVGRYLDGGVTGAFLSSMAGSPVTTVDLLAPAGTVTAMDINDAGDVVATITPPGGGIALLYLYRNGVWTDINTLRPSGSTLQLQTAVAINNLGWIVGGAGASGTQGYVLIPPPPTSANDAYQTTRGAPLSVSAPGVLANDVSNGGGRMTAALVSPATSGTVALAADGSFTYTPPAGFVGVATFAYRAQDGGGAGNVATVTITVTAVTPTSVNDSYTTGVGTSLVIAAPGVLANDDTGGASITAVLVTAATQGTVTLDASGAFVYTPHAGFAGTDAFTYRAQNSIGAGNVATVTLTVAVGIPTTVADVYAVDVNSQLVVPAPGVLGNDVDNGGGALSAQLVSSPASGVLTLNADGSFTYLPNPGFSGTDGFSYRATSSAGAGNPAIVTLTVQTLGIQPPTNLRVDSVAGQLVTLRWTPPAAGPEPTGYLVEGGLTPGAALASLETGLTAPVFTLSVAPGAFFVRVYALSGAERSTASNEVRLFVDVAVPPSPPANLVGLVQDATVALAWRNTYEGGAPTSVILDVTGPVATSLPLGLVESFTFVGVPPGTYALSLRAVNAAGSSAPSNAITLTFPGTCSGPPRPPTNILAHRVGNRVTVQWDPPATGPAPTSYTLTLVSPLSLSLPTTARAVSGVVVSGNYVLRIHAVNACGVSAPSALHTVVVP
jgi:hypothetical protein